MNLKNLLYAIEVLPPNVSVMLTGVHGIGKTEWTKNVLAKRLGLKYVSWHPAHASDTGDVTGVPYLEKNQNGKDITKFAPPEWMLQDEPVLLNIDEANRGLALVQNAIMQLTCSGEYGNVKLPKGSRIVACINPDDDGSYDVNRMDLAQRDRFAWYTFEPSVDEWLNYASEQGYNFRVISYISKNNTDLDPFSNAELVKIANNSSMSKLPSRRSWERVSSVLNRADEMGLMEKAEHKKFMLETIAGIVGTSVAINFKPYINQTAVLDPKEIMTSDVFKEEWKKIITNFNIPDAIKFSDSVDRCVGTMEKNMEKNNKLRKQVSNNYYEFVKLFNKEVQISILNRLLPKLQKQEKWIELVLADNNELKKLLLNTQIEYDV